MNVVYLVNNSYKKDLDNKNFPIFGGGITQLKNCKKSAEKFGVNVKIQSPDTLDLRNVDLVHLLDMSVSLDVLVSIKKPLVVTPAYWTLQESVWGHTIVTDIYSNVPAKDREIYLNSLAIRELVFKTTIEDITFATFPKYNEDITKNFRDKIEICSTVLPNSYMEMANIQKTLFTSNLKFKVIPNVIDSKNFVFAKPDDFTAKYKLNDFILCAARVDGVKNTLLLAEATKNMGIPVVLAGGINDEKYLKLLTDNFNHIVILGQLDQKMLASAYAAAKIHAFTSWRETPGLSALEAAAVGNCSIVTASWGAEIEYFKEYAYYCDPANVKSIEKAIYTAINNYDMDKYKRLEFKNYVLSNYSIDNLGHKLIDAYSEVLSFEI